MTAGAFIALSGCQASRHIGGLLDQTRERQPGHVSNIVIGKAMAEFQHRGAPFQIDGPLFNRQRARMSITVLS